MSASLTGDRIGALEHQRADALALTRRDDFDVVNLRDGQLVALDRVEHDPKESDGLAVLLPDLGDRLPVGEGLTK